MPQRDAPAVFGRYWRDSRLAATRNGKYGGESRKPIRGGRSAAAARHLERGADAVRRHEAELARGVGVAAAGDEHRAEPAERRLARRPVARTAAADGSAAPPR